MSEDVFCIKSYPSRQRESYDDMDDVGNGARNKDLITLCSKLKTIPFNWLVMLLR